MKEHKTLGGVKQKLVSRSILTFQIGQKLFSSFFSCKLIGYHYGWILCCIWLYKQAKKWGDISFHSFPHKNPEFCSYGCKQFEDKIGPQNTIV